MRTCATKARDEALDGKGDIVADGKEPIEKIAPGVIWRQSVSQPMQTGLKAIYDGAAAGSVN